MGFVENYGLRLLNFRAVLSTTVLLLDSALFFGFISNFLEADFLILTEILNTLGKDRLHF